MRFLERVHIDALVATEPFLWPVSRSCRPRAGRRAADRDDSKVRDYRSPS
jgi:hypothetical protein